MFAKIAKYTLFSICLNVLFLSFLRGQSYSEAPWMTSYNEGDYDSVVNAIPTWLQDNDISWERQVIPYYFLGESFYTLGLASPDLSSARAHFRSALSSFQQALEHADVLAGDYAFKARYKQGWSQVRLAEVDETNAVGLLQNAFQSFKTIDNGPEALLISAAYMTGECRLRLVHLEHISLLSREMLAADGNRLLRLLDEAQEQYNAVRGYESISDEFKAAVYIRLKDVNYLRGKIYQTLDEKLFQNMSDAQKQTTPSQTAHFYFSRANFSADPDFVVTDQLQHILTYSDALRLLQSYIVQQDNQSLLDFTDAVDRLPESQYRAEMFFRRGNQAQTTANLDGAPFRNLGTDNGFYGRAAESIPEGYFWLAMVQSILENNEAHDNFDLYISNESPLTYRRQVLIEEATWRKHNLQLESILLDANRSRRLSQLRDLAGDVESFSSRIASVEAERQKLFSRINLFIEIDKGGSTDDILGRVYGNVLKENVDMAVDLMIELLPRAASTTGRSRARYIDVLETLFVITEELLPNETKFYRGITASLNAEISPTRNERVELFKEAADILKEVDKDYRDEALYVQARSLFFAEEYPAASRILIDLINRVGSLRALFYLGEIYRATERGVAAKRCFDVIKEHTEQHQDGQFWYNNANAAIALSNSTGDTRPLENVNLEGIQFPDVLLRDEEGDPLTYEGLADPKFLRNQRAREAITLLTKFSLPKKNLYPSQNILSNSSWVAEGIFAEFTAPINERAGAITSGLALLVATRDGGSPDVNVTLDGIPLTLGDDGFYSEPQIPLNSEHHITIRADGYYPYIRDYKFSSAGGDSLFVLLNRKRQYEASSGEDTDNVQRFPGRLDGNAVMVGARRLTRGSELYKEFNNNPYLRDYVYHPGLDAFLAVDARGNRIVRFSNDKQTLAQGVTFDLKFEGSQLDSPEGITVDSQGNIYIVDWGHHRILMVNRSGELIREIGVEGENNAVGEQIKVTFPTRISVAEDNVGKQVRGWSLYGQNYILLADRFGLHLCDEWGHYWDTVVGPSSQIGQGDFYGIGFEGYGESGRLVLWNRQNREIQRFSSNVR